jgi:hypothetical protein
MKNRFPYAMMTDADRALCTARLLGILDQPDVRNRLAEMALELPASAEKDVPETYPTPEIELAYKALGIARRGLVTTVMEQAPGRSGNFHSFANEGFRQGPDATHSPTKLENWIDETIVRLAAAKPHLATLAGDEDVTLLGLAELDQRTTRTVAGVKVNQVISTGLRTAIFTEDRRPDAKISRISLSRITHEKTRAFGVRHSVGAKTLAELIVLKIVAEDTDQFRTLTVSDRPLGLNSPGHTPGAPSVRP